MLCFTSKYTCINLYIQNEQKGFLRKNRTQELALHITEPFKHDNIPKVYSLLSDEAVF